MEYLFRSKEGYQFFKEKKEGITAEIDTLSKTELDSSNSDKPPVSMKCVCCFV